MNIDIESRLREVARKRWPVEASPEFAELTRQLIAATARVAALEIALDAALRALAEATKPVPAPEPEPLPLPTPVAGSGATTTGGRYQDPPAKIAPRGEYRAVK